MTNPPNNPSAHIELIPAAWEHEPILANLLELYMHDFSEFLELEMGADGRFGYKSLLLYFAAPDRYPFLVKFDGKWAGFAFVKQGSEFSGSPTVWDMAEFFILRGCRRRGIGARIARDLWNRFPGPWEVRVMETNVAAQDFWARAISSFTGVGIRPVLVEKGGLGWHLYTFKSANT
jgi:predicted acetyltransferase